MANVKHRHKSFPSKDTYPYQDTVSERLKNERWKDIPSLEGYYRVSNFGRVRRLPFEIICSNGQLRQIKPRFMAADIGVHKNKTVKDEIHFLRVKIMREGALRSFSLSRLVYYCFIKKFDLSDHLLVVLCKDGNGKNIHPDNLALVNISYKQKRAFDRNRSQRTFVYSYEEFMQHGSEVSSISYCKQVSQYTQDGRKIQTYPSIAAAGQALDIRAVAILAVLKERQVSCGGFVWRYGKAKKIDMEIFRESRSLHHKKLMGQKVSQYNAKGKRVATYLTMSDAARATGIGRGEISVAANGKQKSAGGYIWKKSWGKAKIDLSKYVFGETLRAQRLQKKVKQYSAAGKYIQTFPSVKEAAKAVGLTPSSISTALDKEGRVAKNFIWKSVGRKSVG
jgi:hypothetical protein